MGNFHDIKKKRKERYQYALNVIKKEVNSIYGKLTSTKTQPLGGTAFISPERDDIPFAEGTIYSVIPPHKKERNIETLSGGEQTLAIVALCFSLNMVAPAPIFVLDEVDSALDAKNVARLAEFLSSQTIAKQLIVISHKPSLFWLSNSLVGITRRQGGGSKAFRVILRTNYQNDDEPSQLTIAGE